MKQGVCIFKIQLHDFEYTSKRTRWGSKQLRFSITWSYTNSEGQFGLSMPGCLAAVNKKGELNWSPPMTYFTGAMGPGGKKHMFTETPDLYHLVRRKLAESAFGQAMTSEMAELMKERDPWEDNPELPKVIEENL